jgi:thiol-disulfide isomerase/thioredoxin
LEPVLRLSLIACLPLGAALATAACDRAKPPEEQPAAGTGQPAAPPAAPSGAIDRGHAKQAAPALPFAAPGGAPATLGTFRGKPLLVNLWATWCAPCVRELPTLDALAAREKGKLQVVAISQDSGGDAQVGPFWAAHRFTSLTPYTDARMGLMEALKVDVLPTTILYDAKGREIWRMVGDKDWAGADVAKLLAEAK